MVQQRSIGLPPGTPWEALVAADLPEAPRHFNIATACTDEQRAGGLALVTEDETGEQRFTFGDLANRSARLATGLRQIGVMRQDRVAIVLPQRWEAIAAMLATFRIGAIAVPLDPDMGPDALALRLNDSEPRVVIVDDRTQDAVKAATNIETVHTRDGRSSVQALIAFHQPSPAVETTASHPALLIYEGQPTGPPAGVLLAHSTLLGWLPSLELAWGWFPREGDVAWTRSSWATSTALLGTLLPALYHGAPTIASIHASPDRGDDGARLRRHAVTCMTTTPQDLAALATGDTTGLRLRSIAVVGAAGSTLHEWAEAAMGVTLNEVFTTTSAGPCIGTAEPSWVVGPDGAVRPHPGFVTEVLDVNGDPTPREIVGQLAVRSDHLASMIEYWRRPHLTNGATRGDWLLTGRRASRSDDGTFRMHGTHGVVDLGDRLVGPWEIERCLEAEPDVAHAAVVGSTDARAGELVKAYVVTHDRSQATPETAIRLATRCGERLAPHLAPKRISFVAELPIGVDGEVDRALLGGQ